MVLAGMDQDLLVALTQGPRDGCRLDELGAVADDGEDSHAPSLDTRPELSSGDDDPP